MIRTATLTVAGLIGALVPLRPFFLSITDPATETLDLLLCPAYLIGRMLPRMGDEELSVFFVLACVSNALLYWWLARTLWSRLTD